MDRLGLCRLSRSQNIQKFFGSFFQKRTEKKEAKNIFQFGFGLWADRLACSGRALDGFDLRVPWCPSCLRG